MLFIRLPLKFLEVPVHVFPHFSVGLFIFFYSYALQILDIILLLITYIVNLLFQVSLYLFISFVVSFLNEAS